jgi:hypothetical protein
MGTFLNRAINWPNAPRNDSGMTLMTHEETRHKPDKRDKERGSKGAYGIMLGIGFKTWDSIESYPTPNIVSQELKEILDKVSFADKIVFGRLKRTSSLSNYHIYFVFSAMGKRPRILTVKNPLAENSDFELRPTSYHATLKNKQG